LTKRLSVAPKVVTTILEGLVAIGVTPLKPAAFLMKKVSEQRQENALYLLESVISQVRRLQDEFTSLSDAHKQFVEEEFPRLMVEAVSRAEQTLSKERIERLSLIVVQTLREGPQPSLDSADEMLRVTIDLSEEDVDILAKIYSVQFVEIARMNFLPDQNIANSSWKKLQAAFPIFQSSEIHSICAKLQSLGLLTQVPRITTMLDLTSIPYAILRRRAEYVEAVGKLHTAKVIG
jgi:hypothetical protein